MVIVLQERVNFVEFKDNSDELNFVIGYTIREVRNTGTLYSVVFL